jgi:hypothetical protein
MRYLWCLGSSVTWGRLWWSKLATKGQLVQTSLRAEGEAISLMLAGSLNEIASPRSAGLAMTFGPRGAVLRWLAMMIGMNKLHHFKPEFQ